MKSLKFYINNRQWEVNKPLQSKTTRDYLVAFQRITIVFIALFLFGCHGSGGFRDIAFVRQAQRELRRIRNALEEYKMDNDTYPEETSDLKVKLAPYLARFVYSEGKEVSRHSGIVLGARNNLDQIRTALSGCARIQEPHIEAIFEEIQNIIASYADILSGDTREFVSITQEVEKLKSAILDLSPEKWKSAIVDSLIQEGQLVISTIASLLSDSLLQENLYLKNIKKTFEWYVSKLHGELSRSTITTSEDVEIFAPESELSALLETEVDASKLTELQSILSSYKRLEERKEYCRFLTAISEDLERVKKLIIIFEEKLKLAPESAKIVAAQTSINRMADALNNYRRVLKKFPPTNVNIDSILRPYFIEVIMSGDSLDHWTEALKWFAENPTYETQNQETMFILKARANDMNRTQLSGKMVVQNRWDDIVSAFSSPITYSSTEPTTTYFLKTRAKDSGRTIVTDRPPITIIRK